MSFFTPFPSFPRIGAIAFFALVTTARLGAAETVPAEFTRLVKPFLADTCLDCHDGATQKGNLDLEAMIETPSLLAHREKWEAVYAKLRLGEMPPKDEPRPDAAQVRAISQWLLAEFERQDKAAPV